MTKESLLTLPERLYDAEKKWPDLVYLKQPIHGVYKEFTFKEAMMQARKMSAFLKSLGLKKGDAVSILSKNCAEWIIADLAVAMAGMVNVPFFPNQAPDLISYILNHAEVKAIFVGKLDNWEPYDPIIPKDIVRIDFPYENSMPAQYHWADVLANTEPDMTNYVPNLDDTYAIIYTSGTTGKPKGAVYTYRSIEHHTLTMLELQRLHPTVFADPSVGLAVSPFGHCMGHQAIWNSAASRTTFWFVESLATFLKNLQDAQPTLVGLVPRIWTQFQKGVLAKIPQEKLDRLLKIPVVRTLVKRKIKKSLGLLRAKITLSGAAPLSKALHDWYEKLGVHLVEGYGQTENLSIASIGIPHQSKIGTVGKPVPFVEVKISDDGEILTRSKLTMSEYYKNPEATKAAFTDDGFLRTGDMGHFDEDGFLVVTGRLKDPFKTDKGEFVNPLPIEAKFMHNHNIEQLCLIGISLVQPVLLVVLSQAAKTLSRAELTQSLLSTLNEINPSLTAFEHVSHIVVVKEAWTPENDLMTASLKVKRNSIHNKYIDKVQDYVKGTEVIVWE